MKSAVYLDIPDLDARAFQPEPDGRMRLYKGRGGDNGADEMRRQEAERQARITAGTTKVNDTFAQFGDDYYGGVSKAFLDYHTPLVDEQYQAALRGLPAQFGSTASSEYNRALGELTRDYERQKVTMQDSAKSFADQQRQSIENARSTLLSQVQAGAGVEAAGTMATQQAAAVARPPAYSPIGDLFQKYTALGANYALGNQRATQNQAAQNNNQLLYTRSNNARVVT